MKDILAHFSKIQQHVTASRFFVEFFYNSLFPGKSWYDPASIDIQWSRPVECQCWQDPAMICQEISNCRKTRVFSLLQNDKMCLDILTNRGTSPGDKHTDVLDFVPLGCIYFTRPGSSSVKIKPLVKCSEVFVLHIKSISIIFF